MENGKGLQHRFENVEASNAAKNAECHCEDVPLY